MPVEEYGTAFAGEYGGVRDGYLTGWVWNAARPSEFVGLRLLIDGEVAAEGLANIRRRRLAEMKIGDGRHGYSLGIPKRFVDAESHRVELVTLDGTRIAQETLVIDVGEDYVAPVRIVERPKRYYLALLAIAKNEAPYLHEWVAYHRAAGVEHFLIFDNDSDDGTTEMLGRLADLGLVEHVPWPTSAHPANPQKEAYAEGVARLREQAEWIAVVDLDEFIVPLHHPDIPAMLREYPDVTALGLCWRLFGSSGLKQWTPGLVMERFRKCRAVGAKLVKSIARADYIGEVRIYAHAMRERPAVDELRRPLSGPYAQTGTLAVAQVNHYFTKSRGEWDLKRLKGKADHPMDSTGFIRRDEEFARHDFNEVEDDAILRFHEKTRAGLAWLRTNIASGRGASDAGFRLEPWGGQGLRACPVHPGPGAVLGAGRLMAFSRDYPAQVMEAAKHLAKLAIPPVRLVEVQDACLAGMMVVAQGGTLFFDPAVYPGYLKKIYEDGIWLKKDIEAVLHGIHEITLSEPCFVFYHGNCNNFGHFLTEAVPKLFTIKELYAQGWRAPLLLERNRAGFFMGYVKAILPEAEIVFIEPGIRYRGDFLLPSIDPGYKYHPERVRQMQSYAEAQAGRVDKRFPREIFVSRGAFSKSYRRMANGPEIEEIARGHGLAIVRPEALPIPEQAALYRNAEIIVGEYGSGLHNAIYSRPGTAVLALNWINGVQQAIADSFGHAVGFVLPEDGGPVLNHGEGVQKAFNIAPGEFSAALAEMFRMRDFVAGARRAAADC
ncbi:glycosyltransferase family 2 protein [Methylomagnum ishizawai]|uniref:glycosyltransferase family 2 protein n=1 Tax=Methylomagnum ishizawai TaxID=1760988 RepID=UPI001C322FAC|nr:glycosyltransferase family 2 protein [Methylomagnum ishizawai]BBL76476.1 hypothetical protein MishRS11D_35740 [Methylomagnum ishizawai]